jgi:hypothetical protein
MTTAIAPTPGRRVHEPGMGTLELFPVATDAETLFALLEEIFTRHWREVVFGSLIQGAVFELRAGEAEPQVSLLDGYLTVAFGSSHFHVCIGEHRGSRAHPTPRELATHRRTARAEFYRVLDPEDAPTSWGLRLINGAGEQQLTVFLPNPFLDDAGRILETPDWSRLGLWDALRERHAGCAADARDRSARRFFHV